jgi:MFS family permease
MLNIGVPRQLVVVVIPLALVIMGDSLMYIVLPTKFAEFGIGPTLGLSAGFWVGLALSANRFVRLISNTFAARVYERAGLRAPFISAVLLGTLTTLAYSASTGIALLLFSRLLWGVAYSFMRLASQIVAFRFGSDRDRGKYLGFYNMGQRAGSIIAVTGGAVMASSIGSQTTFAVLAGVGGIGVAVALMAPRIDVPSLIGHRVETSKMSVLSRVSPVNLMAPHFLGRNVARYIASLSLMRFSIAFAANGLAIATVSPYLAELLADGRTVFGASIAGVTRGGLLVGTRWFGDLALSIPSGAVSDRLGRMPTILSGVSVMTAVLLFVGIIDSPELFLLLMPLMFFASILGTTSLDATLGESVEIRERAPAFARYSTWQDLGGALGPLLGLTLAEIIGFRGGYLLAAAMLAASLSLLVITSRLPRNRLTAAAP